MPTKYGLKPTFYVGKEDGDYGREPEKCEISLEIKRVIFNDPATIILWEDGTKTVVKAYGEPFDKEKGMAMAILRKLCGAKIRKEFRKYVNEETGK